MNKKVQKLFKSMDKDVQESIKFLINTLQVKREEKKNKKKWKKDLTLSFIIRKFYSNERK